jgi:transmembrane sensor
MDANERRDRVTAEAARWWAQVGNKVPTAVSEADRREFSIWLRESPLHIAEMLRIAHVDDTLRSFESWHELPCGSEADDDNIIMLAPPSAATRSGDAPKNKHSSRLQRFALAASVAVAAVVAGWFVLHARGTVLTTDRAERREVVLADGSVVSLEPETKLRVSLSRTERRITLEQGRALFRVAKDSTRPFLVASEGALVRAVGTIFGVEEAEKSIIVTVKEGKVAIVQRAPAALVKTESQPEPPGAATGAPRVEVLLTSNEQVTISASGSPGPVEEVDASRALAWSEGMLVFHSTPLEQVAHTFNQYNRVQIRIRDAELGHRPVSGVFQASDPQTLVDFIRAGARVTVARPTGGEIVISSVGGAQSAPTP